MKPREQLLAGVLLVAVLGGLFWWAVSSDPSKEGGQFRQIGEQLGERRGGVNQDQYKYVANSRTMQYWPNESQYADAIPRSDRVFILDDDALSEFNGYSPGPR